MPTRKSKRATTIVHTRGANYSREFKAIAVLVSRDPDIETQLVARALGIHPVMLTQWRTQRAKLTNLQLRSQLQHDAKRLAAKLDHCAEQAVELRTCKRQLKGKRHA